MKRRLAMRDRLAWVVALAAVGVVVYLVLPLWATASAVALVLAVPALLRRNRRRARR